MKFYRTLPGNITFNNMEERFNKWLVNRKLAKRASTSEICFDADYFMQNNASEDVHANSNNNNDKIYMYELLNFGKDTKFIPDEAVKSIDNFLDEMNKFLPKKARPTNSEGNPFVDNIKENGQGDFEPVWSSTEIRNPAELLLNDEEKLFVKEIEPSLPFIKNDSDLRNNFSYKNNLIAVYGTSLFVVDNLFLAVYSLENLSRTDLRAKARFFLEFDSPTAGDISDRVNFIKIVHVFDIPMLAICSDSGSILFSNVNELELMGAKPVYGDTLGLRQVMTSFTLNVKSSCWSIDTFNVDNACIVAVGSNLPGVSIFVINKKVQSSYEYISETFLDKTIKTRHNIPSLHFLPRMDDNGGVTLSFVSIFGNVTTVKISLNLNSPKPSMAIRFHDTQFLGVAAWSVTPLSRKDFRKVDEFEFLNLNYHTADRKSILQSVVMDSHILDPRSTKLYSSGSFGIGSLTTQIIVPHAKLSWRCCRSLNLMHAVKLPFTAFDKDGMHSIALINIPENTSASESLYDLPKYSPDRIKELYKEDIIKHYYYYEPHRKTAIPNDDDKSAYNSWFNTQKFDLINGSKNVHSELNTINISSHKPYSFMKPSIPDNAMVLNSSLQHQPLMKGESIGSAILSFRIEDGSISNDNIIEWKDIYNPRENVYAASSENSNDSQDSGIDMMDGDISLFGVSSNENNEMSNDENIAEGDEDIQSNSEHNSDNSVNRLNFEQFIYPHSDYINNYYFDYTMSTESLHEAYVYRTNNKKTLYHHQKLWSVHNHALKVKKLLKNIDFQNELSGLSYRLKDCHDDFLLVTTVTSIILLKASPLIMLSIMYDDIFPIFDSNLCFEEVKDLNRINFVCHIKELNCIVVASQMGYISLLRLTNYKGIFSFRQEYILGWESQDPYDKDPNYVCIHNVLFQGEGIIDCNTCDVGTPYLNIRGMDYSFFPGNKTTGTSDYAILYVFAKSLHKFKITRGSDLFY